MLVRKRRKRNYKAEYARRKEIGSKKGLSLSQSRGHPRAGEPHKAIKKLKPISDVRFQLALKDLRKGKTLTETARRIDVSPERLRNQLYASGAVQKNKRRWIIREDLKRRTLIYSNGKALSITVTNLQEATKVGKYMSAVSKFMRSNNSDFLKPFIDKSVTDKSGNNHLLETEPNILYRLNVAGTESFEQIYRIVV